jgi:hypothetical protein
MPIPLVEFPCGSESMRRTRFSAAARDAAMFTAVVVLPTPPFWFAMAITLPMEPPEDVKPDYFTIVIGISKEKTEKRLSE